MAAKLNVRVVYDPNLAGSLTFSVSDLPPGISYDPTTGEFSGAALRSAVPRNGSPVTYNATITVSDGTETESAIVPFTILDNTFSVEPPATQVSHPGETVFFAPTLSYTQGNFSGPLMFSYENLPSGLSFDSLNGTVQGTIDANLVTPESNIRDYTVLLKVTDLVSGDRQEISFQWRVETDPYPAYVARVEQADAIYISAVEQALSERDSAWQTAVATVQNLADEAYAQYLQAADQAAQEYSTAVEEADAAYTASVAQADAAYQEAESQASAQLHATLEQIWADYVQRVEADYQADLAAADAAYSEYVAPYQSARDLAYEYWQEHPDDAEAYAAYQQAQQDLDNAIAYATAMRDQAYAEAAARRDARLADPYQDEQYANQEAEAYAAYNSALEQAGAAWAAAEQAAYDEWQAAMNAAESTYTQTESQAWNQYLERIDQLNSQLEHTRLILEAAFQTAWNNAVRDWTEMESEAWDAYQRARAQMLRQPPEGERQASPAPVEASNLLAMQVAPRKRSDRLLTHSHDLEFADKVLGRWADWAWSKVFPNPTQQVTNWLQQLRQSKDLNDYFRVLANGAAHILGMPLHTTQFFVLATALDNLRYGNRQYRPVLSTSAGIKEDKPYLKEVRLRSEVLNYSFDLSGIGGLNVGKVSFKLQATNQPDGILDLYGNGEDPIRVTGVVHYKLEIQFSTVSFNSSCDQRWELNYLGGVIPDVTTTFGFNFQ